ncbi:MAG: sporulation initiation factor Spo0A C-terminal domain-containing protein [Oscillospiraceae bacterium]
MLSGKEIVKHIDVFEIVSLLEKKNVEVEINESEFLEISDSTFEISEENTNIMISGKHYILPASYGVHILADIIYMTTIKDTSKQIEISAMKFVRKMGIPANLRGYHLLITAICMAVYHTDYIWNTEELYAAVAKKMQITKVCVERCIRKAIEKAYDNSPEQVQSVFYYDVTKPYCSEVISLAADTIRRQYFPEKVVK